MMYNFHKHLASSLQLQSTWMNSPAVSWLLNQLWKYTHKHKYNNLKVEWKRYWFKCYIIQLHLVQFSLHQIYYKTLTWDGKSNCAKCYIIMLTDRTVLLTSSKLQPSLVTVLSKRTNVAVFKFLYLFCCFLCVSMPLILFLCFFILLPQMRPQNNNNGRS